MFQFCHLLHENLNIYFQAYSVIQNLCYAYLPVFWSRIILRLRVKILIRLLMLNIRFRAVGIGARDASRCGSCSGSTKLMRLIAAPAPQHCYPRCAKSNYFYVNTQIFERSFLTGIISHFPSCC
jgi:hypothetical protein